MSARSYLAIAAAVVLVLLVASLTLAWRAHASGISVTADPHVQDAYWKTRIEAIGGKAAYAEFALAIAQLDPGQQHQEAHLFGKALYEAEGIKGVSTCDVRFSYGCFHEFMGRAIAALGIGVVGQLNDSCRQTLGPDFLACQHGIGHGLIAYLGYDEASLEKSLDICASLPYSDPIGGCPGGAFMEYNLRTILQGEGDASASIRAEDPSDPFAPCDSLQSAYQASCYFWQVQWWDQTGKQKGETIDARFAQIGKWCATLSSALARQCFQGLGNITPPEADFDGARSAALCDIATGDATDRLYCKSFAANSLFVGGAGEKGDAIAVCKGLSGNSYQYCAAYASNKANIAVPIEVIMSDESANRSP